MYNFSGMGNLFKGVNINKILSGSSKTLSIVKQAVPLYKDIKPMISKKNKQNIKEVKVEHKTLEKEKASNNRNVINDTLTFFQ